MAAALPKTKAQELIERLNRIFKVSEPSDLELRAFRREAEALAQSDRGSSEMILGTLAAVGGGEAETRKHYAVATRLVAHDSNVWANYARSLARLCAWSEAVEMYRKALELAPTDTAALEEVLRLSIWLGQFHAAQQYAERFNRLASEDHKIDTVPIGTAIRFIETASISEADLATMAGFAADTLRNRDLNLRFVDYGVLSDEEETCLSIRILVDATAFTVVDMNEEVASRVAASPIPATTIGRTVYSFGIAART